MSKFKHKGSAIMKAVSWINLSLCNSDSNLTPPLLHREGGVTSL